MNNTKFSISSILISTATIIGVLLIDRQIYSDYLNATGKTQALFGITELLVYSNKYYLISGGIIALVLAIFAIRRRESKQFRLTALSVALFAIPLPFISIWRIFI